MKKRILILLPTILLIGCASTEIESVNSLKEESGTVSRFLVVENTTSFVIMVDKETGVMYAVSNGMYNSGTFTVLLDESGKPLLYEGRLK